MAYYAVFLILSIAITSCVTFILSTKNIKAAYLQGWEDAKKVYYTDLKEERLTEEKRLRDLQEMENMRLSKENISGYSPVLTDLLMAYGVSNISQLPEKVKETYNLGGNQNFLDLDTLIQQGGV